MPIFAKTLILLTVIMSFNLFAGSANADSLVGSDWRPTEIGGKSFDSKDNIHLLFEQDGKYTGNGGCNNMFGRYVTNQSSILFSPAAATMMMCEAQTQTDEDNFFSVLSNVREFSRNGMDLDLVNKSGEIVMRLSQREAD